MSAFDDGRHPAAAVEEWVFTAWRSTGDLGLVSGHRILGPAAWYWAALARRDRPLLHVADFDVRVRSDPFVVKGEALWAEHTCDAPMEQWSIGNETYAAALDAPDDALDRAYGHPTAIAFDLEWYATADAIPVEDGYRQDGVVHGEIEIAGEPTVVLAEVPGRRWHRWRVDGDGLPPLPMSVAAAHTGLRAPFLFPDGARADWVLAPGGWARRRE